MADLFGKEIDIRAIILKPVFDELSGTVDPDYLNQLRSQLGL
jgi:hypothetical protein